MSAPRGEPETDVSKIGRDYKYGFHTTDEPTFSTGRGLTREVVETISAQKNEPAWMLERRLEAYEHYLTRPVPTWGGDLSQIDFESIFYYVKPTESEAS